MENKQILVRKKRSFFKSKTVERASVRQIMVFALLMCIEGVALIHTVTRSPELWALTSLSRPLEIGLHGVWLLVFGMAFVYSLINTVTWAQVMVLLSAFAMYTAIHLAMFVQADYDRQRLPFIVAGGCAALLITLLMVARERTTHIDGSTIASEVDSEED